MVKHEFSRFLLVGLTNTAFSYSLYLLLDLFLPYKIAWSAAYVAGIMFSYYLNARWVFRSAMDWKSFLAFPMVYLVQYGIGILCLHVLVEQLFIPEKVAPLIVIVLTIPVTFILSRFIVKKGA